MPARLRGPAAFYRPKDAKPVTLTLTTFGKHLLAETAAQVGASRADVVEQLLRRFSGSVTFEDDSWEREG
jgi:hypothetical protein